MFESLSKMRKDIIRNQGPLTKALFFILIAATSKGKMAWLIVSASQKGWPKIISRKKLPSAKFRGQYRIVPCTGLADGSLRRGIFAIIASEGLTFFLQTAYFPFQLPERLNREKRLEYIRCKTKPRINGESVESNQFFACRVHNVVVHASDCWWICEQPLWFCMSFFDLNTRNIDRTKFVQL